LYEKPLYQRLLFLTNSIEDLVTKLHAYAIVHATESMLLENVFVGTSTHLKSNEMGGTSQQITLGKASVLP